MSDFGTIDINSSKKLRMGSADLSILDSAQRWAAALHRTVYLCEKMIYMKRYIITMIPAYVLLAHLLVLPAKMSLTESNTQLTFLTSVPSTSLYLMTPPMDHTGPVRSSSARAFISWKLIFVRSS